MIRNKILVFGDSITYGQRDLDMGGWVNRLKLALAREDSITSCHVFNMGISGQSTNEILERMERECAGRVLDDANNIIVIAAGINDTQILKGKVTTEEEKFRSNVKEMIAAAKDFTDKVIWLGLTPVDEERTNPVSWDKRKSWNNSLVERYDNIISEICKEEGVRYVYIFDQIDPETNEDGLHPSGIGHEVLAEVMGNVLMKYLKKKSVLSGREKDEGLFDIIKNIFK